MILSAVKETGADWSFQNPTNHAVHANVFIYATDRAFVFPQIRILQP